MKDFQYQGDWKQSALSCIGVGGERWSSRPVCRGLLSGVLCVSWLLPLGVMPAVAQVAAPDCPGTDPAGLGFVINGAAANDSTGYSVSSAGDVNGDGLPDLIIGARYAGTQGRTVAGRAYVVFGKASTTSVDLANLGSGGFVIDGAAAFDSAGTSVSAIGDLNGDGLPELLVGARGADPQGRNNAGRAYVVFGKASTTSVDLANLGSGGFVVDGAAAFDYAGFSVSAIGDVNGDGRPELLVGARFAGPQGRDGAGRAYVVFGKASTTSVDLLNLGSGGFVVDGAAINEQVGFSVSAIGDLNGDGLPELLVGARGAAPQGRNSAGRAYVVFGKASTTSVDLANLGSGGFVLDGAAAYDLTGNSVSAIGDLNGDGLPELLVGAFGADRQGRSDAGRAYVVFGKANTASVDLANLGSGGFVIDGAATSDQAGFSVSAIEDLNGDGLPELLVGALRASPPGRSRAGRAYVVFGKASTTSIDLLNLGTGGFVVDGAAAFDYAGSSSAIGDLNGDGLPELLVGVRGASPQGRSRAGRAYVVFGKASTTSVDLRNVQLSALPALDSALRGATLTLTGNNLSSVSALTLGGVSVPFALNSSTRLTAVLPANAPATGTFTLSTPLEGTFTTATFTVPPTPAGAPTINAVTPTTGGPGTRVSVSGTNLSGGTAVSFCNGLRASGRSGSTQVQLTVPTGATSGPVTVMTTNGSYNFLFTVPPSP